MNLNQENFISKPTNLQLTMPKDNCISRTSLPGLPTELKREILTLAPSLQTLLNLSASNSIFHAILKSSEHSYRIPVTEEFHNYERAAYAMRKMPDVVGGCTLKELQEIASSVTAPLTLSLKEFKVLLATHHQLLGLAKVIQRNFNNSEANLARSPPLQSPLSFWLRQVYIRIIADNCGSSRRHLVQRAAESLLPPPLPLDGYEVHYYAFQNDFYHAMLQGLLDVPFYWDAVVAECLKRGEKRPTKKSDVGVFYTVNNLYSFLEDHNDEFGWEWMAKLVLA